MTRPDDGSTAPDTGATEPGHRARAYAAALLGELTGGRRTGGAPVERDPQDPAAVPDLAASTLVTRGDASDRSVPQQEGAEDAGGQATADVDRLPGDQEGEADVEQAGAAGADADGTSADGAEPADPVSLASDEAPHARAAEEPLVGDAPALDAPSGASLAGGSPAVDAPPAPARVEAPVSALVGTPVRTDAVLDRTAPADAAPRGPRPSPFTYVEVAAHHTGPARTRAGSVLDSIGGQFSARADREQVRRAARTAVEAAALLDACDALDARAAAVDGTWNGERHGATEVREFEGAWGAFYDTSSALSASV